MRTTLRGALVAMVIGVGSKVVEPAAFAQTPERPSLRVVMINHDGIAPEILSKAQAETSRIYAAAGVDVYWQDAFRRPSDAPKNRLTMLLVREGAIRVVAGRAEVMGIAPGAEGVSGRIAYAFYARIERFARKHRLNVSSILGHVMAHELGHLLLAYGVHSYDGIMQADWGSDRALEALDRRQLTFTKEQAAWLQDRLTRDVNSLGRTASLRIGNPKMQ